MKIILTFFLAFSVFIATAQKKNNREKNRSLSDTSTRVSDVTILRDIPYAWYPDNNGTVDTVGLDLYLPKVSDSTQKFPLMMIIHGGGFRKGDKGSAGRIAEALADSGFVTVSINYRIGWDQNQTNKCDTAGAHPEVAFYKAQQDARAAIRYLVGNAEKYRIDTSWIFVQGSSAGGVTSLNLVYFPQDSADRYLPGLSDSLGGLDTAGNTYRNSYTIKGIGALWGALLNPDLITPENAVPTIFFHGERDRVVPWDASNFYKCPNFPKAYGSKPLFERMKEIGKPAVAIIDPEGGHGIYDAAFREQNIVYFFRKVMQDQIPTKWIIGEVFLWNAPED